MSKAKHPFPRILKIPANANIKGVANLAVEKQEPFRLVPGPGNDSGSTKHPFTWGRAR